MTYNKWRELPGGYRIYHEKPYQEVVVADLLSTTQLSLYVKISNHGMTQQGYRPYIRNAYFGAYEYSVAIGTQYSIPKRVPAELAFVDMQAPPALFTPDYGPAAAGDYWWLGRLPSQEYNGPPGGKGPGVGEQRRTLIRRNTSFISVAPSADSPGLPVPIAGNQGNNYCDIWLFSDPDLTDVRMSASIELSWLDCSCGSS